MSGDSHVEKVPPHGTAGAKPPTARSLGGQSAASLDGDAVGSGADETGKRFGVGCSHTMDRGRRGMRASSIG